MRQRSRLQWCYIGVRSRAMFIHRTTFHQSVMDMLLIPDQIQCPALRKYSSLSCLAGAAQRTRRFELLIRLPCVRRASHALDRLHAPRLLRRRCKKAVSERCQRARPPQHTLIHA